MRLPAKRRLHDVLDARGERRDVDVGLLVGGLRFGLPQDVGRRLDLDDVGAEQGGHMGGVGADIHRRLARLVELAAARVGPHDDGEADRLGLLGHRPDLLHHLVLVLGARIDREADRRAADAQRILHRAGDGLVLVGRQRIGRVELEDGRDGAGEGVGAGLERTQGRRIGVQPGVDRELVVIVRIVGVGVGREGTVGAVLEALVDGQDHHLARAAQPSVHQDAGEIGLGPRAIALVIVEDLLDLLRDLHRRLPRGSLLPKAAPVIAGGGYSFKPLPA